MIIQFGKGRQRSVQPPAQSSVSHKLNTPGPQWLFFFLYITQMFNLLACIYVSGAGPREPTPHSLQLLIPEKLCLLNATSSFPKCPSGI